MAPSDTTSVIPNKICAEILNNYSGRSTTLVNSKVIKQEAVGFFGEYYKIVLTYRKTEDKTKIEQANFFAKVLPQSNDIMKEMNIFKKEVSNYNNLIRPFLEIASSPFAPNCYYSDENGLLVLEDLTAQGFKVSQSNCFTYDQNKSLMKTLARFHAASLIFEEKQCTDGEIFRINEKFQLETTESTFSFIEGHPRYKWCIIVTKCVADLIMILETDIGEKLTEYLDYFVFNKYSEFLKPSKIFRNVLNHDDLHQYNIFFSEKLYSVLVDFQLTRYTPPAYDVLLALYMNNNITFLEKNKSEFFDIYYNTLSNELKNHNLEIKKILPRDEFKKSLDYYLLPVLIECAFYGTIILISDELSQKVRNDEKLYQEMMTENRSKHIVPDYQNNEEFRKRYNQVLIPLINVLKNNIKY